VSRSRRGGAPNRRLYSRLNCDGLSYPTRCPTCATSRADDSSKAPASCSLIRFWYCSGVIDGIDVPARELLTFAMLVSLGGCEPQVKGHVAANLHVGNDRAALLSVITALLPFIGYPRTLNALRVVNEVTKP
jgi:alkylhydroperoxidase/carboxymuconolactone decarboxylase family protein YurZ